MTECHYCGGRDTLDSRHVCKLCGGPRRDANAAPCHYCGGVHTFDRYGLCIRCGGLRRAPVADARPAERPTRADPPQIVSTRSMLDALNAKRDQDSLIAMVRAAVCELHPNVDLGELLGMQANQTMGELTTVETEWVTPKGVRTTVHGVLIPDRKSGSGSRFGITRVDVTHRRETVNLTWWGDPHPVWNSV